MTAASAYPPAALAEIARRISIWAWWRLGASHVWLMPSQVSLALQGLPLDLVCAGPAGRGFAAYRGANIAASILWIWLIKGSGPTGGT